MSFGADDARNLSVTFQMQDILSEAITRSNVISGNFNPDHKMVPRLTAETRAFGGPGRVTFNLLSNLNLKNMTKDSFKPDRLEISVVLKGLGYDWVEFLWENSFVAEKFYLIDFISKDVEEEFEKRNKRPLNESDREKLKTTIEAECYSQTVEKIKPKFFDDDSVLPLTDDNVQKLAACLLYVEQEKLKKAFLKCFDYQKQYKVDRNRLSRHFKKWLGLEIPPGEEHMQI